MTINIMEVTIINVYRNMYYKLFNAITDALNALEQGDTEQAREVLITAQQTTEELYMRAGGRNQIGDQDNTQSYRKSGKWY
jgi:hypothetical protein